MSNRTELEEADDSDIRRRMFSTRDATAEQAARIERIRRLAREQLDQGEERGEVLEAVVLLAHLRPGRAEEAVWSLKVIARDLAREMSGEDGEPVYPCFEWTGELLCAICGYLEDEGWAYDYGGDRRWLPYGEMMARYEARNAAEREAAEIPPA